jgi:ketosteroid isomerase-like protein/predicted ester cyclase
MSRTIVPVALALVSLAACAGTSPPAAGIAAPQAPEASRATLRERQLATLDALKRGVEARDARAIAALYTDDAVVVPFGGRTLRGRAEIERSEARQLAPAAAVRASDARIWLKGDVAIVDWRFNATLASPAKAPAVGTTELSVMWFAPDGRIREEHEYMNQGTLRLQAEGDEHAPPLPDVPATVEVHDGPAADEARAVAWANRYEDASSRDDAAAVSMMDEHITWRCSLGFSAESREPFPAVLAHWRAAFPDMHWQADHVWPVEDFIIVEETLTGTHKGKIGPFEGSGRPVKWHWAEVWQVKDGRIAHGWSYANFGELRPQVSDAPAPAAKAEIPCSFEP